jgi:hypothetical protein
LLPEITIPLFEITVPSSKTVLTFRPYLVKEEKVILMAVESEEEADLVRACKQVLVNCCRTELDVDSLTTFDMEYLFLKLRAQSVNNISKLAFIDTEDEKRYEFDVDLDAIEVKLSETSNKIKAGEFTIEMRYPTIKTAESILDAENEFVMMDKMIANCIVRIYDDENVYDEFTEEELLTWLDAQTTDTYDELRKFFESTPQLEHTIEYTNSKGSKRTIKLAGLPDFFHW